MPNKTGFLTIILDRWLGLNRFRDDWERSRTLTLYATLTLTWVLAGLLVLINLLDEGYTAIFAEGLIFLLATLLLILARLRRIDVVSWLLPFGILLVIAMQTFRNDGIFDDAMFAYPGVIILAGLLNRRRGVLSFTLLVLVAVATVGLIQILGPEAVLFSDRANPMRLFSILMLLLATGGLAFMVINDLLVNLRKLNESQSALLKANQELKDIQASMEATIEERTRKVDAARHEAELARRAIEAQAWLATGISHLNDVMRGEQDIRALADKILDQVCSYLNAQTGALFVMDHGALKRVGGYAYTPKPDLPDRFEIGDGLIGQAALSKEVIVMNDIPEASIRIASGMSDEHPKCLVFLPLLYNDDLVGVIELGLLNAFKTEQVNFLTLAQAGIAVSLRTTLAHMQLRELLNQTQRQAEELQAQAEELQAQEEELRAVNEELAAQAENLRAAMQSAALQLPATEAK